MKQRKRLAPVVVVLVLAMLTIACAGTTAKRHFAKSLEISADLYEGLYPAFVDLYKQGLITTEEKARGTAIAEKFWLAYHIAVEALIAYDNVDSKENQEKLTAAIVELSSISERLLEYIEPLLKKGGK